MEFTMKKIPVDSIKIAGRHRQDLGDIDALAASIDELGLIHPITVTESGNLIAGQRRLEAYRKLGRTRIQAQVVSDLAGAVERLHIERDENTERKPMTPEELVTLGKSLEELERPKARQRRDVQLMQGVSPAQPRSGARAGTGPGLRGETRGIVAKALGIGSTSYRYAKAVVDAAADPDATPEERAVAEQALKEMNETGLIRPAYAKVRPGLHHPEDRESSEMTAPSKVSPPLRPKPAITRAQDQRNAIARAITTLSGLAYGLRQIDDLHPNIKAAEASQWAAGLSDARQAITILINRLKEHSNAAV